MWRKKLCHWRHYLQPWAPWKWQWTLPSLPHVAMCFCAAFPQAYMTWERPDRFGGTSIKSCLNIITILFSWCSDFVLRSWVFTIYIWPCLIWFGTAPRGRQPRVKPTFVSTLTIEKGVMYQPAKDNPTQLTLNHYILHQEGGWNDGVVARLEASKHLKGRSAPHVIDVFHHLRCFITFVVPAMAHLPKYFSILLRV